MKLIYAILLSACYLMALSCGHQDTVTTQTTPPPASPVASPNTTPTPAVGEVASPESGETSQAEFEGTTRLTEKKRLERPAVILKEVRTGKHENFDRVVFEFAGAGVPGYHIEYIDKPAKACGSGEPVQVGGANHLVIQMMPAHAHTEAGEVTIQDRERVPGLPVIKEMKLICDFEADVQWVLGVAARNPYRVLELSKPARLVIDIRHSSEK
jgi:hypothetical protein